MPIIPGTPGNDTITGSLVEDTITAGAGDDLIDGNAGDDTIYGDGSDSTSGGGSVTLGTTLGDGPGSTGGGYDRVRAESEFDTFDFSTDAFYLGNDIPLLAHPNYNGSAGGGGDFRALDGVSFSQDGAGTDRTFGLDELSLTGGNQSYVGIIDIERSDIYGVDTSVSSSLTGPQDLVMVNNATVNFTMNDGTEFPLVQMKMIRDEDGNTFMVPGDGAHPDAFNSFRHLLDSNDSGIRSFEINHVSDVTNGVIVMGGDWADGQFLETIDDGGDDVGDDTIDGSEGDDLIFGDNGVPLTGDATTLDISDMSGGQLASEDGAVTTDVSLDGFIRTTSSTTYGKATPDNVFYSGPEVGGESNTLDFEFDTPVSDVSFTLYDVNQGAGWDDQVRVVALDADGNEVPVTFSGGNVDNGGVDVRGNTIDGNDSQSTYRLDGNNPDNVQVHIDGPISSLQIIHEPGDDSSTVIGWIGVGDIDVTPVIDPDGLTPSSEEGGEDVITGGEGQDTIFGEGGDDTIIVGSAAEGAGDVIDGGNGPDATTDNDVLDLRGAGDVTVDAVADENDAGAQTGTVTFEDGSTLEFEGIETILQDPAAPIPDGTVDGEDTGEDMGVGYDDANDPTDGGGDLITDEADVVEGNGGDDTIDAGAGDDLVDGGGDDDLLDGGAGDDTLLGGIGTDTLDGGAGADELDGGGDDDDITVGAGDIALGGSGDDDFFVDPSEPGTDGITVIGGETGEDLTDPTNGGDGDTLDLRGLGHVDVAYDDDDPEAGTATYINDDGLPVTITFSEIEEVLTDPQADDVVDGLDDGEVMAPGYTDDEGDQIDGDDGIDDVIEGNGGPDTIDAGLGDDSVLGGEDDDVIDGGAGDDTLLGNEGNDDLDGGDGDDTLLGGEEADTLAGGEGDDLLEGEDGDDDIAVGGADTAEGGLGDDVFTVDPTDTTPDVDVTIDGGSDGTTGDPAGPENGDEGDILDLSDQTEDLVVTFEPEDGEAGTVDGLDDDGTPDITFEEIEQVVTGSGDDEVTGPEMAGPCIVSTGDGDDTVTGSGEDDTIDGGGDDDLLDGGDGDDDIMGGDGNDTLDGGEGDDTLDGGAMDDDITVGTGDTALGGAGDDEFFVDPTQSGTAPITVIGGEDDEEALIDPTNNPDGRIGDVLDLTGLGPVDVVFDEDDPEAGTATYLNDDGEPVTINFSEIEEVLVDDVVDTSPVANPDTAEVTEEGVVEIDVLANDTDPDTPVEELDVIDAEAENGIVDINPDGTLSYEPDAGFTGEDTINYTITDPDGNEDTSTVTVTVNPDTGSNEPDAVDDAFDFDMDGYGGGNVRLANGAQGLLTNDTDPNDDALRVVEIDGSSNLRTWVDADNGGQIRIGANGAVRFRDVDGDFADTPDGEVVQTSVSYTVSDGNGGTDTATVTVNVTGAADVGTSAPDAVDDTASATAGDVTVIDVLSNDTDPDTPLADLDVVDADAENGIVDINDDGTLSYEPDEGFTGPDTITYTITDPEGNTDSAIVTVSVVEGEVTPIANPDTADVDEDDSVIIDVLANDTDPDTPVEELVVTEATAPNGEVVINDDGTLSYTPDPDFNGEDQITYTVSDPDGNTATGTATVDVAPINDAPEAENDTAATDEETPVTIDVLANDSDVDNTPEELSVIDADAPNGIVDINDDGTLSYEPDAGFTGTDTITYTISDPSGATSTATVAVSVASVDQTPVANPDTADVDEDDSVIIDVLANDTDPDTPVEELVVTEATAPNGEVEINDDGTLSYTPDPDFNGEDQITYTVSDPDGNTATGTATVDVAPINDAPEAVDDSATTDEGETVTIDVLANDSDVEDGNDLDVIAASASNGSVTINDDGTLDYTPDADFTGTDTISYTVEDSDGATDTASVSVEVDEVTGGDGVVDGADTGEAMDPGYDDGEGDQVDGTDGIDDVIEGNGGNDTINAGLGDDDIDGGDGNDVIRGGDGDDTIEGSTGLDEIFGGAGDDTYQGDDEGHIVVYVDDDGNGDVTKYPSLEGDGVNSIEHFSGAEIEGQDDKISFTTAVGENSIEEDIQGLDDTATGYFFPEDGNYISFGPESDYMLSDIFSGTSPDGELPAVGPVGEFFVNGGPEEGQVGDISFENFEHIFFTIEEEPDDAEDFMSMISNSDTMNDTMDETMPQEDDIENEQDLMLL